LEIRLDPSKNPFNLDFTLECGQAFRWEKIGGWWYGVVRRYVVKARQNNDILEVHTHPEKSDSRFWRSYFRLDDDLPKIYSQIVKNQHIKAAVERFEGLRLLRQEPWECLISYVCATNKNIPAIKDMIFRLCENFGERLLFEGREFYTFPTPNDLANADIEELRACKLGFRAERVQNAAKKVNSKELSLEALHKLSYEEAWEELLKLPGVGPKVADCVLLFSLDKLEAFPIDVWMKRIVMKHYHDHFERSFVKRVSGKKSLSRAEYRKIGLFGRKYFGKFVGYAQEYLYHYERCMSKR
jgi:N-glycosylase/DNA lyase